MRRVTVRLWTLNRWLRWTGFRLFVALPVSKAEGKTILEEGPTSLGLVFYGWSFVGKEPAEGRWP